MIERSRSSIGRTIVPALPTPWSSLTSLRTLSVLSPYSSAPLPARLPGSRPLQVERRFRQRRALVYTDSVDLTPSHDRRAAPPGQE